MKKIIVFLIILSVLSCKNETRGQEIDKSTKYDSLVSIGSKLFLKENYESAVPYFIEAIEINNNNPIAHYRLGVTYTAMADNSEIYADKAINSFKMITTDFERANYNLGICYMIKNDFEKALNHFDKAITKDPSDIDVLINSAISNISLGNIESACTSLSKVKKISDDTQAQGLIEKYCN